MIVYKVTNLNNGKCYIGKSKRDFDLRWKEHCYPSQAEENRHLARAIQKDGIKSFSREVLFECSSEEEMSFVECLFIVATKSYDPRYGYNLTFGGDGLHNPSPTTRKKMSNSHKGKKQSVTTCNRRSCSLRTAWVLRRKRGDHLTLISSGKRVNEERKGKTWEQIFGKEKASQIRAKRLKSNSSKLPLVPVTEVVSMNNVNQSASNLAS